MATTPGARDSSALHDLDVLLSPQPEDQFATFAKDALAPFTDMLFYDWDLGRFLDSVDCNGPIQTKDRSPKDYRLEVPELGVMDEDFFAVSDRGRARDHLSAAAAGHDFFKFPAMVEHAISNGSEGTRGEIYSHTQQHTSPSIPAPSVVAGSAAPVIEPGQPSSSSSSHQGGHQDAADVPPLPVTAPSLTTVMSSHEATISPTTQFETYTNLPVHQHPSTEPSSSSAASSASPTNRYGTTPELDAHILSVQERARLEAEEDKRRRNTAASARFRIKKKQREQATEKAAKEMAERVTDLEKKISQLELENRWLRNLLVEKNTARVEALTTRRDV